MKSEETKNDESGVKDPPVTELKIIDFSAKAFPANGKKYSIHREVSIQRAVYIEACKQEIITAMKPGKQSADWKKVYDLANQSKFADIVILAHNNMNAITKMYEDANPIIKLCCCYFNFDGEDIRTINDDLISIKINDFAQEGYANSNFFAFALAQLKVDLESSASGMAELTEVIKKFNQEALNTPIQQLNMKATK